MAQRVRKSKAKRVRARTRLVDPDRTLTSLSWNGPSFLPQVFKTRFTAIDHYADTDANGFADWVYRANSPYDPDYGVGGSMAVGFANMNYLYNMYCVNKCVAEITLVNNADLPVFVSLTPTHAADAFVVARQEAIPGFPFAKSMMVCKADGGKTLRNVVDIAKLFAVRDLDSVNFSALMNTNPATPAFWHVTVNNNTNLTALDAHWSLTLTYETKLSGLRYDDFIA
jgi:hypothetical protein